MSTKYLYVILSIVLLCQTVVTAQNLLNNPESVVFDSVRHRYIVSNWGDGAIIQIDSNGTQSYYNIELMNQYGLAALYLFGDTLLVAAGNAPNAGISGFDLATATHLFHIPIPGVGLPNDITTDTSGIIYVTDYWGSRLYKIIDHTPILFMSENLNYPNGMMYDRQYNRLLILSVTGPGAPILAVNLEDSSLSTLVVTGLAGCDGIAMDRDRNVYLSTWEPDAIHKYDSTFTNPPQVFSTGQNDPADIYYDRVNDLLVIPNFGSNTIEFIPINPSTIEENGGNKPPVKHGLLHNYPNPFNPTTTLTFCLTNPSELHLNVYNICGKNIATLTEGYHNPGTYDVVFDGSNLASGNYFYQLNTEDYTTTGTMVLLK